MKTGPTIARGKSKQDYQTPPDFMAFVRNRFGPISFDLAASPENTQADEFYTIQHDSLKQDWSKLDGLLWLNPPFDNIGKWAEKCRWESMVGAKILFLVPASVGSNWFRDYVFDSAKVMFLNGRISFDGANPFPKDCMLACYGPDFDEPKFSIVKWKPLP